MSSEFKSDRVTNRAMNKKRRTFQTNPKDPSRIRTSIPTGFRSADHRSKAAKVDEPKTSEFAFFKKLKTNAGHGFNCHNLHKEEIEPNKLKSNEFSRERSSPLSNRPTNFNFHSEDRTRANRRLLHSSNGLELNRASTSFQDKYNSEKSSEGNKALTPGGLNENDEALYRETWLNDINGPQSQKNRDDLFMKKRKKLSQWVADISFPETEELCSEGYDFVSVLISRLFPASNEESRFQISKPEGVGRIRNSILLPSSKSNNKLKELHHSSTRNFSEAECIPYLENSSSACWFDSFREGTVSNSDSLTCHADNICLDYDLREPSSELRGKNKVSRIGSDSAISFPSKNYRRPSVLIRELDDFHDSGGSSLTRMQHPLLLNWDSENLKNERTSLISQNTELSTYPSTLTLFADDRDQSLHEFGQLCASELSAPSSICKYSPAFLSPSPSLSISYCKDDHGREFLEDKEHVAAYLGCYPFRLSSFSHLSSYQSLTESCHDITCEGTSNFLLSEKHHCFTTDISWEQHSDQGTEDSLSPELNLDFRKTCFTIDDSPNQHYSFAHTAKQFPPNEGILSRFLPDTTNEHHLEGFGHGGILHHYGQDMVNTHHLSSFYFQVSVDKQKSLPLLLPDRTCWDSSDGELYDEASNIQFL